MLVKLEDENSFVKNIKNNSLINQDKAALSDYKNKKLLSSQVNHLTKEINIMKSDIKEIKSLIVRLINSKSMDNK